MLISNLTSAFGSGCIMLSSTLLAPLSFVGFILIIAGAGINLISEEKLANHEKAEAGYKIEMARFNDLVEQIMALPESPGTGAVVIHWSGIKTEADIKKLNITPKFYSKNIPEHPSYQEVAFKEL